MKNREVESLNSEFGVAGAVAIAAGAGGLPKVILSHASGARAEVYLHGATVTSWTNPAGGELLFLSRESLFENGKPIRGGIPICFPQFAEGPLPKHGIVRTAEWRLARTEVIGRHGGVPAPGESRTREGDVVAVFQIEESPESLKIWPFRFAVELTVTLGQGLSLDVSIRNSGDRTFDFNLALHTYFRVADIRKTWVSGLRGIELGDYLRENRREIETRERIAFDGETDRIYCHVPDRIQLRDDENRRTIVIEKKGMDDVVIWNPWIEKSKRLQDFEDDEYLQMVCVETGALDTGAKLTLEKGREWRGETKLRET